MTLATPSIWAVKIPTPTIHKKIHRTGRTWTNLSNSGKISRVNKSNDIRNILTAVRVGYTQSNMSHPRATHTTRSTASLQHQVEKLFLIDKHTYECTDEFLCSKNTDKLKEVKIENKIKSTNLL